MENMSAQTLHDRTCKTRLCIEPHTAIHTFTGSLHAVPCISDMGLQRFEH
jgi:hypothetical protein